VIETGTEIGTGTDTETGTGTNIEMGDIGMTGKGTLIVMNADGLVLVPAPATDVQQLLRGLRNLLQQTTLLHHLQKTRK
jgi:hypothetical protein